MQDFNYGEIRYLAKKMVCMYPPYNIEVIYKPACFFHYRVTLYAFEDELYTLECTDKAAKCKAIVKMSKLARMLFILINHPRE